MMADKLRMNIRERHAQSIAAAIMRIVERHVDDRADVQAIHDEIGQLLHDAGAEIVTDEMRHAIGLPARGPDGWTAEELHKLEQERVRVMTRPEQPVFFDPQPHQSGE